MGSVRRRRTRDHETGIVWTKTECRAYVRVRGTLYTKRFDPARTTLTEMRDWRAAKRVDVLAKKQRTTTPSAGSFAADVAQYLAAVKTMPSYVDRERDMQYWVSLFGTRSRDSITSTEIRAALQQWRIDGKRIFQYRRDPLTGRTERLEVARQPLSDGACNRRRTALMHFYSVLNTKSGANPVKDVPKFREPDAEPRGLTPSQLRKMFQAMPDSKTKARALVLATTGLPHATLMRLTPEAVNYRAKTLTVPRRRKGKGTKVRTLPLSADAVRAFKLLTRWDAWGAFSHGVLWYAVQRACKRAGVPPIRGYDLRHSFATAAYLVSGDIRAVQGLLDHSDAKLTERYTMGAVEPRMRSAISAMRKVTA